MPRPTPSNLRSLAIKKGFELERASLRNRWIVTCRGAMLRSALGNTSWSVPELLGYLSSFPDAERWLS